MGAISSTAAIASQKSFVIKSRPKEKVGQNHERNMFGDVKTTSRQVLAGVTRYLLSSVIAVFGLLQAVVAQTCDLEEGFRNPPDSAKPHTWYHLMNGNVTKEPSPWHCTRH